jgi:hypothetical protein
MTDDDNRIWRGLRAHLDELGQGSPSPDLAALRKRADHRNPALGMSLAPLAGIAMAVVLAAVVLGQLGRSAPAAIPGASASQSPSTPAISAEVSDVTPVSLSAPSPAAAAGIRLCLVRSWATQVAGIGIIDHARLLPYYVPLTGQEPEIQNDSPAFVVQFSGTIPLPVIGGRGSGRGGPIIDPLCVVLKGLPIWFATGPWMDSNGHIETPKPAPLDTRALPAPLP